MSIIQGGAKKSVIGSGLYILLIIDRPWIAALGVEPLVGLPQIVKHRGSSPVRRNEPSLKRKPGPVVRIASRTEQGLGDPSLGVRLGGSGIMNGKTLCEWGGHGPVRLAESGRGSGGERLRAGERHGGEREMRGRSGGFAAITDGPSGFMIAATGKVVGCVVGLISAGLRSASGQAPLCHGGGLGVGEPPFLARVF